MDLRRPAKLSIERMEGGYASEASGTAADLCMLFGILGASLMDRGIPVEKLMRAVEAAHALGLTDNAVTLDLAALRRQRGAD